MEAAADGFVGNLEVVPSLGAAGVEFLHGFFREVQRASRCVGLKISTGAIPFDGIAPLGDLPLEFGFRQQGGLGKINLDAVPGSLDVADVDQSGKSGGPEASDGSSAGIQREMIAGAL